MAGRRSPVTEIREILRRLQLGERARRIARDLEVSRNTVAHYRQWAATQGLLTGPLPEPAALAALLAAPPGERPAQEQSLAEPFREQVLAWHAQGVEGQAIWQLLVEQHGFGGSYSSIKRFLRRVTRPTPRATLRLEVDPGEEAQVDYGFLIAPCRPRTPEHKGKVEQGGVHYVKRNALAGRAFRDFHDGNRHLLHWCLETAGRRVHGTTKQIPLEIFDQVERAALHPLPVSSWELTEWKRAKLHPDCHVVFAGAYYSGPHRLIGQRLWVRATDVTVELYQDYALVTTHRRARPGQRRTLTAHLPPDKVHFLLQTPTWCRARAAEVGPTCSDFIERLLGDRPLDRLRSAQGILRLGQRYSPTRLEAACDRALAVGEYRYHTVKTILAHALDSQPLPNLTPVAAAVPGAPPRHARPWTTFFPDPGAEEERAPWN